MTCGRLGLQVAHRVAQQMPMPTPSNVPVDPKEDTEMDTEMLPEDYVLLFEKTPETEGVNSPKKMRIDSPSSVSTTANSPAACLGEHQPRHRGGWTKEIFANMTEEEIRDRLGIAGTSIAMDWEREDLLATLMEIDKVNLEMSKLGVSM
eukprot:Skav229617  [mRNA]  locus=scaffold510:329830:333277:- [translate_table: standard]